LFLNGIRTLGFVKMGQTHTTQGHHGDQFGADLHSANAGGQQQNRFKLERNFFVEIVEIGGDLVARNFELYSKHRQSDNFK